MEWKPGNNRSIAAFTLIELLVVMTIITILGGLALAGLQLAQRHSHTSAVRHDLTMLKVSIESFSQEMGDYPPTTLSQFKVSANSVNEGNESLFACLLTRKKNGPFVEDLDESKWQNYDGDKLSAGDLKKVKATLDWARDGDQLLEYTDFWDNPFVYIHNRDYGRKFTYRDAEGRAFEAQAAKNPKTGGHAAPTSYQLWSLGPDGINQNGGGDDICSWKS